MATEECFGAMVNRLAPPGRWLMFDAVAATGWPKQARLQHYLPGDDGAVASQMKVLLKGIGRRPKGRVVSLSDGTGIRLFRPDQGQDIPGRRTSWFCIDSKPVSAGSGMQIGVVDELKRWHLEAHVGTYCGRRMVVPIFVNIRVLWPDASVGVRGHFGAALPSSRTTPSIFSSSVIRLYTQMNDASSILRYR